MIGVGQKLMILTASWQWVVNIFSDQQRMVQIGAVIAVAAIFLLSRAKN